MSLCSLILIVWRTHGDSHGIRSPPIRPGSILVGPTPWPRDVFCKAGLDLNALRAGENEFALIYIGQAGADKVAVGKDIDCIAEE